MTTALLKAASFILIILLCYGLKKGGLFGPKDYTVLVKTVINITLPGAILVSFSESDFDMSLLLLVALGFLSNCLLLGLGFFLGRKRDRGGRALWAIGLPGYNIGAFVMPFAQSVLGASGAAAACLFDTGNAIMCTGGSYAVTDTVLGVSGQKPKVTDLLRKLSSSTPFIAYLTMLILTLCGFRFPQVVVELARPIANANPYCAMAMIGLMFEMNFPKETIRSVLGLCLLRVLFGAALACGFFFLLPMPLYIRQTLTMLCFAPPSVLTPAFVEKCGGSAAEASCLTSLCSVVSVVIITILMMIYGAAM